MHETRWQEAVAAGEFGVWDLAPQQDQVQHSAAWKRRLGYPREHAADSTAFWRCRVHPDDLAPMLDAMRRHFDGSTPLYECRFRLRSNGSGYRTVLSRGLVVERDARGEPLRMMGTMVDLTPWPSRSCRAGLPFAGVVGPRLSTWGRPAAPPGLVMGSLFAQVPDLLDEAGRSSAALHGLLA